MHLQWRRNLWKAAKTVHQLLNCSPSLPSLPHLRWLRLYLPSHLHRMSCLSVCQSAMQHDCDAILYISKTWNCGSDRSCGESMINGYSSIAEAAYHSSQLISTQSSLMPFTWFLYGIITWHDITGRRGWADLVCVHQHAHRVGILHAVSGT